MTATARTTKAAANAVSAELQLKMLRQMLLIRRL
jgi:hypothetical protein